MDMDKALTFAIVEEIMSATESTEEVAQEQLREAAETVQQMKRKFDALCDRAVTKRHLGNICDPARREALQILKNLPGISEENVRAARDQLFPDWKPPPGTLLPD